MGRVQTSGGGEFGIETKVDIGGQPPQDEVDAAYQQLAEIRGEPVDAVTPYDNRSNTNGNANVVVDQTAVQVIDLKQARAIRALSSLRPAKRVKKETIEEVRSERRSFHQGIRRTRKVAKKLGQSVTAATKEYRQKGAWRSGRTSSTGGSARRLPKGYLITEG